MTRLYSAPYYKILKKSGILLIFLTASFNIFAQSGSSDDYVDEGKIPYGVGELNITGLYSSFKEYKLEDYTITGNNPYNGSPGASIPQRGLVEKTRTGIGVGLDVHLPLIYILAHKNKSRLRLADDFGLGTYLTSNSRSVKSALTGETINPEYLTKYNTNPPINGGLLFVAGIQVFYRVNKLIDIGAKYYPYFLHYDFSVNSIFGPTYGLHARIQRCYLDWRVTVPKIDNNIHSQHALNNFSVKYLLNSSSSSFLMASLITDFYTDPIYGVSTGSYIAPEYRNYVLPSNKWIIVQAGWGLLF
jgi:hypothetical protein